MKIKPLEWVTARHSLCHANTEFGKYIIYRAGEEGDFVYSVVGTLHRTLEDAKQAAETHWQERVKRCLID